MTSKIRKTLNISLRVMRIIGLYDPVKFDGLYRIYTIVVLSMVGFLYLFGMIMHIIYKLEGDILKIANVSYLLTELFVCVIRMCSTVWNAKNIRRILNRLDQKIFNDRTTEQEVIIDEICYLSKKVTWIFFMHVAIGGLFIIITPLFDSSERTIPLGLYFMFDPDFNNTLMYFIFYGYSAWAISTFAYNNIGLDTFGTCLIIHAYGQLKVLRNAFQNLRRGSLLEYYGEVNEELEDYPKNREDAQRIDDIMCKRIKICVEHHKAIMEYIYDVQDTLSTSLLWQFVATITVVCFAVFQLTVLDPKSMGFISIFTYLSAVNMEILMHCWYGTLVKFESIRLRDAIYQEDWYKCGPKVNKALLILMERTKRPVIMMAGGFFTVTMSTWNSVFRKAYSGFALLRTMQQRKLINDIMS